MKNFFKSTYDVIIIFAFLISVGLITYYVWDRTDYSLLTILVVCFFVLNILISLLLLLSSRQELAKVSWFFIINLLPGLGAATFFIFGRRYKYRITKKQYKKKYKEIFNVQESSSIDSSEYIRGIASFVDRPVKKGNLQVLDTGSEKFTELFNSLRNAKSFIHLTYYIFKPGEIYQEFEDILKRKIEEGVEVKLIVDEFGSWAMPWHKINYLKKIGVKLVKFNETYFPFIGATNGFRLHKKIAIIDSETIFVGGLNIADEYAHLSKKFGYWLDMHLKLTGPIVRSYALLFIQDWYSLTNELLDFKKYAPIIENTKCKNNLLMIESGPENKEPILQDLIVKWILNSKKSIFLTTPYLIPSTEVFSALKTASLSGVDIKIIIPDKADKKTVLMASKHYARMLSEYNIKIYQVKDTFIHSKFGIFDDKYSYIGTMNLDIRSLFSQFEIQTFIEGEDIKKIISKKEKYLSLATEYKPKKIKINFFYLIKLTFIKLFISLM
ncbi:MAG: cardiolipin synthase [Mycoplasma sp.]|nr:cardiolipin synthase [Mycoplasma sp.]